MPQSARPLGQVPTLRDERSACWGKQFRVYRLATRMAVMLALAAFIGIWSTRVAEAGGDGAFLGAVLRDGPSGPPPPMLQIYCYELTFKMMIAGDAGGSFRDVGFFRTIRTQEYRDCIERTRMRRELGLH